MGMIKYIILVALCAASISYTITFTSIFKEFREWVAKFHHKLEELIYCPYCFCHYVILVIMFTTKDLRSYLVPITESVVYNFLFTWFCIVCVTSLLHFVMLRAYRPVMEYLAEKRIAQIEEKRRRAAQQK